MLAERFDVSLTTAERDISEAKALICIEASVERPLERHRVLAQLHRIADAQERRQPLAAVGALREVSRVAGLLSPQQLEVTHPAAEPRLDLRNLLDVLPERGLAALDVVLECMAELEKAGRLLPVEAGAEPSAAPEVN